MLEMLEEESLEETKIEIENELKQSTSESKVADYLHGFKIRLFYPLSFATASGKCGGRT